MLKTLIILCGIGHIALGMGSLLIPTLLNWKADLAPLPVLIRQMFWTYAGYILSINIFFGIISILFPGELLSGDPLAKALLVLIVLYWFTRIVIQFTYFDKKDIPKRPIFRMGEIALNVLFIVFTVVYGWALFLSMQI